MARKLIGQILREQGKVTQEQVLKALERQELTDKALGRIFFDMGIVSNDDILRAWSQQIDAEIVDLATISIPSGLLDELPREVAEEYHVFPVGRRGDALVIAMSDPLDDEDLARISALCNRPVQTVIGSALAITQAIKRHYA